MASKEVTTKAVMRLETIGTCGPSVVVTMSKEEPWDWRIRELDKFIVTALLK